MVKLTDSPKNLFVNISDYTITRLYVVYIYNILYMLILYRMQCVYLYTLSQISLYLSSCKKLAAFLAVSLW